MEEIFRKSCRPLSFKTVIPLQASPIHYLSLQVSSFSHISRAHFLSSSNTNLCSILYSFFPFLPTLLSFLSSATASLVGHQILICLLQDCFLHEQPPFQLCCCHCQNKTITVSHLDIFRSFLMDISASRVPTKKSYPVTLPHKLH